MKKFNLVKGVIDNIRQSVNTPSPTSGGGNGSTTPGGPVKLEQDVIETLNSDQFTAENTLRHGFPFQPVSIAFDPLQKLLAIGNREGRVRIYGRPGIDLELLHESDRGQPVAVMQIEFVINQGRLLTACTDNTVNLWEFKEKQPKLLETLKLNKEQLVIMHLEFADKWVYLGTDKGNVMIMNLESFSLAGYTISWNKCMSPLDKSHPGTIIHLSVSPIDSSKLMIGFDSGLICLWDLPSKKGEHRYPYPGQAKPQLTSVSWHMEGTKFVASYTNGALVTYQVKPTQGVKNGSIQFPHGKTSKDGKASKCDPIDKVAWRVNRKYEDYLVFSGGLLNDVTGVTPSITIMQVRVSDRSPKL